MQLPSTTFPAGLTDSRLPIGLNVVGPEFSDLITIDVARLLQTECGYAFEPPAMASKPSAAGPTASL